MKYLLIALLITLSACASQQPTKETFSAVGNYKSYHEFQSMVERYESAETTLAYSVNYPVKELIKGIEGDVYLLFNIDTTGKAYDVKVLGGKNFKSFEVSTLNSFKKWIFKTKAVDNKLVKQLNMTFKVEFIIKDSVHN